MIYIRYDGIQFWYNGCKLSEKEEKPSPKKPSTPKKSPKKKKVEEEDEEEDDDEEPKCKIYPLYLVSKVCWLLTCSSVNFIYNMYKMTAVSTDFEGFTGTLEWFSSKYIHIMVKVT